MRAAFLRLRYDKGVGKRRKTLPRSREISDGETVYLSSYEVGYDAVDDPQLRQLPAKLRERIPELYAQLSAAPQEAIPEIIALKERFPEVPLFATFLSVAYAQTGEMAKADEATAEAYEAHPDNLFTRVNYADLCRRRGELDKIPEIFQGTFDLQALYPQRRAFHISEFVSFTGVIGLYLCAVGRKELARRLHGVMLELAPDDDMTALLGSQLIASPFKRLFGWRFRS